MAIKPFSSESLYHYELKWQNFYIYLSHNRIEIPQLSEAIEIGPQHVLSIHAEISKNFCAFLKRTVELRCRTSERYN